VCLSGIERHIYWFAGQPIRKVRHQEKEKVFFSTARWKIFELLLQIGRTFGGGCGLVLSPTLHYLIKSIRTSLCSSKLKPRCHYDRIYQYKRRQKAVCCSLLSSTSSMGRSGELSDFEHGLVIGCHISKKSVRDIATLLKLPMSMVGEVIMKWKSDGTTTTKPQVGRPRLMTDRDH
jgi:hypothetical protein